MTGRDAARRSSLGERCGLGRRRFLVSEPEPKHDAAEPEQQTDRDRLCEENGAENDRGHRREGKEHGDSRRCGVTERLQPENVSP